MKRALVKAWLAWMHLGGVLEEKLALDMDGLIESVRMVLRLG